MWSALDLHLCHYLIGNHLGDQPDETVACRAVHHRRVWRGVRLRLGERGKLNPVDGLATTRIAYRGQLPGVRPPPNGVIAYSKQLSNFSHPIVRHMVNNTSAAE